MTPRDDTPETRSVQVEVEVPGTPEQVWEAIATGPGISAWFVPTEVDEREGGTISQHHGAGMDETGMITAWEPPHRFAFANEQWRPTDAASPERVAAEFLVEARAGGTCIVRVVNSGFGSGADWDRAIESIEPGWRSALDNLRLYLTHFPGQRASSFAASGGAFGTLEEAWTALTSAMGLPAAAKGERLASGSDAPQLAGVVERAREGELLLRIDEPAPGLAYVGAGGPGDEVFTFVRAYLYGDEATPVAARAESDWQAWLDSHFPSAETASEASATSS
jgi:uncharacterized protein YndB with AHSA1/START domain